MEREPKTYPLIFWQIGWMLAVLASFASGALLILCSSWIDVLGVKCYFLDVISFDLLAILVFRNPRVGAGSVIAYCIARLLFDVVYKNEMHGSILLVMTFIYIAVVVIAKKPERIGS